MRRERAAIRRLLEDSPSLRGAVADMIAESVPQARAVVEDELAGYGEASAMPHSLDYTEDQVLGDWLPE